MTDPPGWPVPIDAVTEAVVATAAGDGWAIAALGLHPDEDLDGDRVRARTWGRTRTCRGFERAIDAGSADRPAEPVAPTGEEGVGTATTDAPVVQFVDDPVTYVEAALGCRSDAHPVVDGAAAWVGVGLERLDSGADWVDWALDPGPPTVRRRRVPTVERGFNAVVELTVAASRIGVADYDSSTLRDRCDRAARTIRRCGGERERAALTRAAELADGWTLTEDRE